MAPEVPFSAIAEVNPPRAQRSGISPTDQVSFVAMADVSESGDLVKRQTRRLRDVAAGYTSFREEDVLFAKITPCMENGKGAHARGLVNGVGFGSTEFHVLRARAGMSPRFVFHWSRAPLLRRRAEAAMTGSAGQQRVDASFFDRFHIPSIAPDQQQRIGEVLDALDDAVRATEQVVTKLTETKAGLLDDLLTRGLDDNGELRDPDRRPGLFVDSPSGRIPRSWRAGTLADFIDGSPQNGLYKPAEFYGDTGTPIIRIDSFYDGVIEDTSLLRRVRLTARERAQYQVGAGDLLINRVNSIDYVGKAALAPAPSEAAVFESNIMRLRVRITDLDPRYGMLVLGSPPIRAYFQRRAKAAVAQVSVNQDDVKDVPFSVPMPDEQAAIVARSTAIAARIDAERSALSKLRRLKHGLVADLLAGRVRVVQRVAAAADGNGPPEQLGLPL